MIFRLSNFLGNGTGYIESTWREEVDGPELRLKQIMNNREYKRKASSLRWRETYKGIVYDVRQKLADGARETIHMKSKRDRN